MKKGNRKLWVAGIAFFTITVIYLIKMYRGDTTGWGEYLGSVEWLVGITAFGLTAEHHKDMREPNERPN